MGTDEEDNEKPGKVLLCAEGVFLWGRGGEGCQRISLTVAANGDMNGKWGRKYPTGRQLRSQHKFI